MADDHDLLIRIHTMLEVALKTQESHGVQIVGLADRIGTLEARVGTVEATAQERTRLPNWVPTAAMIAAVAVAVIGVIAFIAAQKPA